MLRSWRSRFPSFQGGSVSPLSPEIKIFSYFLIISLRTCHGQTQYLSLLLGQTYSHNALGHLDIRSFREDKLCKCIYSRHICMMECFPRIKCGGKFSQCHGQGLPYEKTQPFWQIVLYDEHVGLLPTFQKTARSCFAETHCHKPGILIDAIHQAGHRLFTWRSQEATDTTAKNEPCLSTKAN
jgi:hypothetical protein